eukprot:TRINITY_DN952_c0_g1_i2.p1 TRINITY_DN952_c0_g1~~TRINITY_DN952_c0_g1_i2.p1  ORF type:complete len:753 (+),score=230.11 TRINITY_DN952_c0_g1_i2:119-2260(+)
MGFGNFSAVGAMLKAFMDLQKEQLAVEKAKTEANKAKVDLAMNEIESEDESEESSLSRRKRSLLTLLPFGQKPVLRPAPPPPVPPMRRPMSPPASDPTLTPEEKVTLKKVMGFLELPQVKSMLSTMSSLGSGKASRRLRQSGDQAAGPPPAASSPPSASPPASPPPPQSSQQQSDNDWKKYLGSPSTSSPTASGSGGDWSKYMGSSTSSGSWGSGSSQTRRDAPSWGGSSNAGTGQPAAWPSSGTGSQPASPSPSSSPPPGSFDWANGGSSSGGKQGWSSGSQRRRLRSSSLMDPSMSPVHGSMNIMNLPMYSSPTPNNIPNLSFSLSPKPEEVEEEDDEDEELRTKEPSKKHPLLVALPPQPMLFPPSTSSNLLMTSPSLSYAPYPSDLIMPPTQPTYASSPLLYSSPLIFDPQPMDTFTRREPLPSPYKSPLFYNTPSPKFYNNPTLGSSSGDSLMALETPVLLSPEPKSAGLQLYRLGRSPVPLEEEEDSSPISIYKVTKNDITGTDEIKKLIFDLDQGIIVSQSDRSKVDLLPEITEKKKHLVKRSIFDDEGTDDDDIENELEDIPFVTVPFFKGTEKLIKLNHHFEKDDDPLESKPVDEVVSNATEALLAKDGRASGYQYQADGSDTDYDYAETPQVDEGPETQDESRRVRFTREVKIGFDQKGELPPGSTETLSAGGGQSPGHHEGGGLTVKIKIPPKGRYIIDTSP